MKNWTFRRWNNSLGWLIFGIALIIYFSTMERKLSFWDCGEYIASAIKLQVTHAPGAALFQLIGATLSAFAFGNGQNYAIIINGMSALCSAFTILFLFWTVTHFAKNLFQTTQKELNVNQTFAVLFSGIVGALAFTFSDTFWFSAVEGEVYAMASMFIALILWLICKWEEAFDQKDNQRWIILIFFITGLSLGVHMMCMLAVPAVCLIYYTKKYKFTWKGFLLANLITLVVLAMVFKVIFPTLMTIFSRSEITFVNGFGLPFHSGTIFSFLALVAASYYILKFAYKRANNILQTITLSSVFLIIGFFCWMVLPVRANANPAINLNNPDSAIGLLDYYNRVQYGDWPTTYGENYTAYLDPDGIEKNDDGSYKTVKTGNVYVKNEQTGRYDLIDTRDDLVYNKNQISFLPRMFSNDKTVIPNYMSMYGAPEFSFNYDNEDIANDKDAYAAFEAMKKKYDEGSITYQDYINAKKYKLVHVKKPDFGQNLNYFISFQNGYYFVRYLLWNFVGRQNDLQGELQDNRGNWISGFSMLDNALYGDQGHLSSQFKNESTVKFFFLPLILGLIGFFFQLNKDFGRFYAILSLFILTSFGIIYYTGVKPFEPRERDYAVVGSFYAFAIWIGLGATALFYLVQQKIKKTNLSWAVGAVLLGIPLMMGFQNYRPHDRSQKTAAYDSAYSILKSLPKDSVMITYADNDTYPTFGLQQTENFRDDVRIVHQALVSKSWFINQTMRKVNNSEKLPLHLTQEEYQEGTNEQVYLMSKEEWKSIFDNLDAQGENSKALASFRKYITQDSMTFQEAIAFLKMKSEDKDQILQMIFAGDKYAKLNFLPVHTFTLPVNTKNAVEAGIIKPENAAFTEKNLVVNYTDNTMYKYNLFLMDLLANFDWKRPINFSATGMADPADMFFLRDYLQFDGFSYRLVPIKTTQENTPRGDVGRVDAEELYRTVKNFKWGNFKNLYNHYDEIATSNIMSYRLTASRTAQALVERGDKKRALEVLDLATSEIPFEKYNDPRSIDDIVYAYLLAGNEKKALALAAKVQSNTLQDYNYYKSLDKKHQKTMKKDMASQPYYYSMIAKSIADAYARNGEKEKGLKYLLNALKPVDSEFRAYLVQLQNTKAEYKQKKVEQVQEITPFYEYLFDAMQPYDSAYASARMKQINSDIMKAVQ
ncbi:protein O-mannosyl-transferase family [Elizabethkingia miricola]|uniref:protein O-mannosyl-transferase family n=1 Tax=Elizabethkingia miricola TaxID=172045 RepID=UPI003892B760